MAAEVRSRGSTFEAATSKQLFDSFGYVNLPHLSNYHTDAVSADGQHFLIPRPTVTEVTTPQIAVVLNWADGIKK